MSHKLGITIQGTGISDQDAKILALYLTGLGNKEIYTVTFISVKNIHNKVSFMYQMFRTPKIPTALTGLATLDGFDHYCYVNGVDVLDEHERQRLEALRPHLWCASSKIVVTLHKK